MKAFRRSQMPEMSDVIARMLRRWRISVAIRIILTTEDDRPSLATLLGVDEEFIAAIAKQMLVTMSRESPARARVTAFSQHDGSQLVLDADDLEVDENGDLVQVVA